MVSNAGTGPGHNDDPDPLSITPDLVAELQAGLLDDATAARVRSYARSDPEVARIVADLAAVRRELTRLGDPETFEQPAPEVPEAVTTGVVAALRAAPPVSASARRHSTSRPQLRRGQRIGLAVGMCAVVAAVVVGAVVLTGDPGPVFPSGPTAAHITVDREISRFPLTEEELHTMLSQSHDLGPLADPQRQASCLAGLGYSPTLPVLGGRTLEVFGRSAVLLLVPSGKPNQIHAVAVEPSCTAAHTGLLSETMLPAR